MKLEARFAGRPSNMSHLLFPPRGVGRPTLGQVLSEPSLRQEFLQSEATIPRGEFRKSMAELSTHLSELSAARKYSERRRGEADRAVARMRGNYERAQLAARTEEYKQAWSYADPADFFQKPMPINRDPSTTNVKNTLLQGIYGINEWKPPHWEHGGWTNHLVVTDTFGTKPIAQMSDAEKKTAARLERKLARAAAMNGRDAFLQTTGFVKKDCLERYSPEYSVLNKSSGKKAWTVPRVATHEVFSSQQRCMPEDKQLLDGLRDFVTQPDRATSFERNIVIGPEGRTDFWRAPKAGSIKGSAKRREVARQLLCPRGCQSQPSLH